MLSPLDCLPAKAGGAVNSGAYAPFILTARWLGWLSYLSLIAYSFFVTGIQISLYAELGFLSSIFVKEKENGSASS